MLAFSDKYTSYKQLQNAFFTLEGHAQALAVMESLLKKMGNPVQRIAPEQKALYHAAAATLSNQVVALLASGYEMLEACGFDTENARRASAALVRGNVENVIASGCVQALTGPIERGDLVTVEALAGHSCAGERDVYGVGKGADQARKKEKSAQGLYRHGMSVGG